MGGAQSVIHDIDVLIDGELEIVKGKHIRTLEKLDQEFKISFDFICGDAGSSCNLIHFTTQHDVNADYIIADGHAIPAIYHDGSQLQIYFSVHGNPGYSIIAGAAPNVWHSVVITQENVGESYAFSVIINNITVHNIVNNHPKMYNNVKVYASNTWNESAGSHGGRIRNLQLHSKKEIDPDLQCPVCSKMITDPTMLDCCHTFCNGCVKKLSDEAAKGVVSCSVCGVTTVTEDISTLWKNELVQKKIELMERKKCGIKCGECEESTAVKYCVDCKFPLCHTCMTHHLRCARSKHHKITDIGHVDEKDLLMPSTRPTCSKHQMEFKYFCEQCMVSTCMDCTHSKFHRGHTMVLLEEVAQDQRTSLQYLAQNVEVKCKEYAKYVEKIEKFVETASEEQEQSHLVVEAVFEKLFSDLQKAKEEQLTWLSRPLEFGKVSLKCTKDALAVLRARTKYANELAKSAGSDINIVQAESWLSDASQQVDSVLNQIDEANGNQYSVDCSRLISHCVSGLSADGTTVLNKLTEDMRNVSLFQKHISRYDHQEDQPDATF